MKLDNRNGLQVLTPESSDFILYNVLNNSYSEKIFLGKSDSIDNYREIAKALLEEKKEMNKVQELEETIKQQNAAISNLAKQLAELQALINKK